MHNLGMCPKEKKKMGLVQKKKKKMGLVPSMIVSVTDKVLHEIYGIFKLHL